ncbi:MAG: cytochrome P450 [Dehalococcoidia bacterium]|nr:cytochrome P450 [Dehalococcoidia bacterium]MYK25828.1 cytochrome P450 [Dehalococcoidia bacterium]
MSAPTATATTLMTPECNANPYPEYDRLRAQSPIFFGQEAGSSAGGLWALLQYDHVYGALGDHETFSSASTGGSSSNSSMRLVLLNDDPPRHTRFRKLVNKAFTPRRIRELEPWLESVVNELLRDVDGGEYEVVQNYTMPLPVMAIAELLGIPRDEYQTFKRWTDDALGVHPRSPEERQQSTQEMMAYFGQMAAARREHGAEDLITALVEAEIEGEALEDWEVLGFCMLLLIAGNETTTNLMGNMIAFLSQRPELWSRLREDRSLIPQLIEEMLRYESPVQVLFRRTTRDVELNGVTIPADQRVGVFYGAANRDPEEWEEPDDFVLERDLHAHVGFGHGTHYCLGSPLARAEARITLNTWLDRFAAIEPAAAPVRQTGTGVVLGYTSLPVSLTGA